MAVKRARLRRRAYDIVARHHSGMPPVDAVRRAADIEAFREALETNTRQADSAPLKAAARKYDRELLMQKSVAIREHWTAVARLRCIITGQPAEIAHCHGGSISTVLGPHFRPGMAQRQNHWLVLPLSTYLHRGRYGLDTSSVEDWEAAYGLQVHLLEEVSHRLGYNVFERAGVGSYEFRAFHSPRSA